MFGCPVIESSKRHADGKVPRYDYTPDGKLARRVWARGIVTDYTYDNAGNLTCTEYNDNGVTPTVKMSYDRAGNLVNATTAGVVTNLYAYDIYGHCTNEWQNDFQLTRFYDTFGRNTGYAINGIRQTTIAYDSFGRISTMTTPTGGAGVPPAQGGSGVLAASNENGFQWTYLPGSDLKSSLLYPNGLTASWAYDANNQLLQVRNATPTNVISQFDYTYDAAGRRTAIAKSGSAFEFDDVVSYGYNARSELTNAVSAVDANYRYSYQYDPIGNRESSSERGTNTTYAVNELNQYTQIAAANEDAFVPEFDDDGNQTLVKTATGIWQVTYNGENRPVLWTCGTTNIVMSYDRMGRRVIKNDQRFVYDGYLQIANFHSTTTTFDYNYFTWDPTEPVATRPVQWNRNGIVAYYVHDGNKNVSDGIAADGALAAHYGYAPFGVMITRYGESSLQNIWRFSSELQDDDISLLSYSFRSYNSGEGRWLQNDPLSEKFDISENTQGMNGLLFLSQLMFVGNSPIGNIDIRGLCTARCSDSWYEKKCAKCGPDISDSLMRLQVDVQMRFNRLRRKKSEAADDSCSIFRPKSFDELFYATVGWDIRRLAFYDVSLKDSSGAIQCPYGDGCDETVFVNGQCHWKWSVNYVLFGWMARLCNCSKKRMVNLVRLWKLTKPKDYFKIGSAVNFARAGYEGFPANSTVPKEDEHSHCQQCGKWDKPFYTYWPNNTSIIHNRR